MQLTNIETPALGNVQTNEFFPMSEMSFVVTMIHQQSNSFGLNQLAGHRPI